MIEFEVMKTLRDIDLTDKANASAKHLSGGQKRKLSIGIAVIGDPKVSFCLINNNMFLVIGLCDYELKMAGVSNADRTPARAPMLHR